MFKLTKKKKHVFTQRTHGVVNGHIIDPIRIRCTIQVIRSCCLLIAHCTFVRVPPSRLRIDNDKDPTPMIIFCAGVVSRPRRLITFCSISRDTGALSSSRRRRFYCSNVNDSLALLRQSRPPVLGKNDYYNGRCCRNYIMLKQSLKTL